MTSPPEPNPQRQLPPADLERLIELASAYREDRIGDAEVAELDMMLSESPAALDAFVEMGMLVAYLSQTPNIRPSSGGDQTALPVATAGRGRIRLGRLAGLAAVLLFAVGLTNWMWKDPAPSFARIDSVSNCLWRAETTPARDDGRIGAGHFRLAAGVAAIRFDNGARVDLEGSSHLEVLSADHCRLHGGKLVVTVENDFKGFTVDTPNGRFVDQGTSFGVTVDDDGAAMVEVFDGLVDVKHRVSGEERQLVEDASVRLLAEGIAEGSDFEPPSVEELTTSVQVTTTSDDGADCSFRRDHSHRVAKSPLLIATSHRVKQNRFDRRICLRFDLRDVSTTNVGNVRLQLTATPSGKGFASKSTDTVIAAYGVVDDTLDDWSADDVRWEELPGLVDDPSQSDRVRLLGRFTIPQGQQTGNFGVEGRVLTDLVRNDSNKQLSIILIAETESKKGMLIHAFASSYHQTLRPPTLHLSNRQ